MFVHFNFENPVSRGSLTLDVVSTSVSTSGCFKLAEYSTVTRTSYKEACSSGLLTCPK